MGLCIYVHGPCAVHLEVPDDLSQVSFIHAYRSFLTLAVWCQNTTEIFSDNGTNLKEAYKLLCQTDAGFVSGHFCCELCNRGSAGTLVLLVLAT